LPESEYSRLATALTPRTTNYIPADHLSKEKLSAQQRALLCLSELLPLDTPSEVLYGGSAGGGKTDALLMAALQYVDVPGYAALILRRTFKQLALADAAMARSHDWLRRTDAKWRGDEYTWTFPSGATLTFGHLQHEDSKYDYQGAAFQFVGFDELTQFTESQYLYLHSRTRRIEGSEIPIRVWSTSNPGGVGHGWVKKKFIDGDALYIPARLWDNRNLDQQAYEQSLSHLPVALRQQLLEGDWDAFEGMAFEQYDPQIHCVPAMRIPDEWQRFESLDHGTTNPTVVLAWCVDYDGNLIVFDSYYESRKIIPDHAPAILAKRAGWWPKDEKGYPLASVISYADPSIFSKHGHETKLGDPASVATEYAEHGIEGLVPANNERRAGRLRVASLLRPNGERVFPGWHPTRAGEPGSPSLFFVQSRCSELCEQVAAAPLLPMDSGKEGAGEIIDPDWEGAHGHAVAALRYGAMSRPEPSDMPKQEEPNPRKRALQEIVEAERERDFWEDEGELDEYADATNWR